MPLLEQADDAENAARTSDNSQAAFLPHIVSIAKRMRQLMTFKLRECAVLPGQDEYLLALQLSEQVSISVLAERLGVRASTVSKTTDILVAKGWVERSSIANDERRVSVHLTDAGIEIRETVRSVNTQLEAELHASLSKDDEATPDSIVPFLLQLDDVLKKRLRRRR